MKTTRSLTNEGRAALLLFFEAFVWLNGKDWLNGNTFNYYWEARSACTAWRGLSSYKAPWTQTEAASLRRPVNLNGSLQWTKMEKGEKWHDPLVDYEWAYSCFNMRFSVLTLLWFAQGRVTCSRYPSLIGHSLFTETVKDAVLHDITLTCARKHSQWKWQLCF